MLLNDCGVIAKIKLTEEEKRKQEESLKIIDKLIKENKLKF
ncbi:hypothetical protein [Clostridium tertium]|nr:hypothetical protein [Clostridium tertium]MDB1970740.1 hypothetical protein [Clostridium tertium]